MSMNGYVYKPTTLFVLRMNAEGTDASIEEHELAKYPELNGWFDDPRKSGLDDEWYKEWEKVGQCVGNEGIMHYCTRRTEIERELGQVKQSRHNYAEGVEKVEQSLKSMGLEDIRKERNMANMDFCSYSDTFYVYGRPFIKIVYRLGDRVKTDPVMTIYDLPCWQIEFFHSGGLSVRRGKILLQEKNTFDEWLQQITQEPEDADVKREEVREQIKTVYGIDVQADDVIYELVTDCYILKEAAEKQVLKELMPEPDEETEEIAKYTTLEGLAAILMSGKIRMNSIVSMNDKTETDFLSEHIKNYREEHEQDYDKYLFADKEFITSFTTRIDELDIWRLYGDNGRGICMVFERKDKKNDGLYKISYINPETDLAKVVELLDALKEKGVRFRLNLLQKYRHFLKHVDYNTEAEYRVLHHSDKTDGWFINRDNGILTPYVEFSLQKSWMLEEGSYPFKLKRIIVGPANGEKIANLMQVFYMGHQYGFSLEVGESKINSYR